jgi:hypothetical protein
MSSQFFWLIVIGFVLYFSIVDPNIIKAIAYASELTEVRIKRIIWWLKNDPSNPIVKYFIWRRSMKMAKQIRERLNKKTK